MSLIECLKRNNMILPNYKEISIIDVVRVIYEFCGYPYKTEKINKKIKQYIKNKKHILLILSDGMGSNLINFLPSEMILRKNRVADLVTVCPTTTGCVLSSVATAEYPAIHGMIGWYNYNRNRDVNYCVLQFKERIKGKNLGELGINENEIYLSSSIMNKLARKTTAFFPEKIVNSNFSKFILNKNRIAYKDINDAFEKVKNNIINNLNEETFTYLYLPYIDSASHKTGVYSEEVKKILYEIENELRKFKDYKIQNLEIIMIADHGQINITEKDITMDFEKYKKYFYALPGIDYGTATYYIKEDKKEEFLNEFRKEYADRMFIFNTEEFIKNNIFGNEKVSRYMKSNLGEFVSFCKKGAYFVNSIESTEKYIGKIKGSHSGFSKEELTIPLIVLNT